MILLLGLYLRQLGDGGRDTRGGSGGGQGGGQFSCSRMCRVGLSHRLLKNREQFCMNRHFLGRQSSVFDIYLK